MDLLFKLVGGLGREREREEGKCQTGQASGASQPATIGTLTDWQCSEQSSAVVPSRLPSGRPLSEALSKCSAQQQAAVRQSSEHSSEQM